MVEWLALPPPNADVTSLDLWAERLTALGYPPKIERDGPEGTWIEITALNLRGYVVFEGGGVEAINFELHASDPSEALGLLQSCASDLGWELYPDDDDADEDE